MYFFIQDF